MPRVLLADDSPLVVNLLKRKLEAEGIAVVGFAKDGVEAVSQYRALKPDLVLMDITMPNKDGREALAEILAMDPAARVIMITAVKEPSVEQECLRIGAAAFCEKANLMRPGEFESVLMPLIQQALKAA